MHRLVYFIKNAVHVLFRKRTIGAQILLIKENKILLVNHTYCPDWFTIGGAVDPGESPLQAIHRELQEEVGVTLTSPPKLVSVYYNNLQKHDDYVILYLASDFEQHPVQCNEIREARWFDLTNLPQDVSPGTQRRVDEYLGKTPLSDCW